MNKNELAELGINRFLFSDIVPTKEDKDELINQLKDKYNKDKLVDFLENNNERYFAVVDNEHREYDTEVHKPYRADVGSAGYDFRTPVSINLKPNDSILIWTDIKAVMPDNEVLKVYIRSSLATKLGLTLTNNVGIIDSTYANNPDNDGNIGISLTNNTNKTVRISANERLAQGIFVNYKTIDNDTANGDRIGGFGSSGK